MPILVTPSGIVIDVRFLHLKNAYSPILFTPSGMIKPFANSPFTYNFALFDNGLAKQLPNSILHQEERLLTYTFFKLEQ